MRSVFLPRSSGSMITELGWSLKTRSAWPNFSARTGNSTQTPSYRLTRFFCAVIVWLPNGHFEPRWSSLFTAGSHARFQSRFLGLPSCGQRTGRLRDGRTTTTDRPHGATLWPRTSRNGSSSKRLRAQRPRDEPCRDRLALAIRLCEENDEN